MPGKAASAKQKKMKYKTDPDSKNGLQDSVKKSTVMDDAHLEKCLLDVYEGKAELSYASINPGAEPVTTMCRLDPASIKLQEGVSVTPGRIASQVSTYADGIGGSSKGVIYTALGGQVELSVSNLHGAKAVGELATMNIVASDRPDMDQISLPPMDLANLENSEQVMDQEPLEAAEQKLPTSQETEISAYLRDPVVIKLMTGLRIELRQGEYVKHKDDRNPKLKFWQTRLTFEAQSVAKDFESEIDQSGLHLSAGQNVDLDTGKPGLEQAAEVVGMLSDRAVSGTEEQETKKPGSETEAETGQPETQTKQEPSTEEVSEEESAKEPVVIKPDLITADQFVQLEDAEYEQALAGESAQRLRGSGKFHFAGIPFSVALSAQKEYKGRTMEKEVGTDRTDFEFSQTGGLYVVFKDPIELQLPGDSDVLVCKLTLVGTKIEDSILTAEKIRIDLGVAKKEDEDEENEEDEEQSLAKKLFGENIHGTVAYLGAVERIDREGIHVSKGKKSLGQFGVSKFLGFLDVEGDYPTGMLEASFEKSAEAEVGKTKLFSDAAKNIMEDGLNIPIVGPLAFTFSISPSVSIGGSLSAKLERGKSFGEKMEPGESMDLAGKMGIEGKGELDLSAGFALSVPVISNIAGANLKVGTELAAGIGVEATADTQIGMPDTDKKLKQTKDLELGGKVEASLSGAVNLTSDVKFLVWKAQVFKIELFKKEVKLVPFEGRATRRKDAKGMLEGWNFEPMGLSAAGFGKKAFRALRDSETAKQPERERDPKETLRISKEAAESIGEDAKNAWVILEDLKKQQSLSKERAYFITEEEKKALKDQISAMTETVQTKLSEYQSALKQYAFLLDKQKKRLKEDVEAARNEHYAYQNKDMIRQQTLKNTKTGGFDFANYEQLKPEEHPDDKELAKENRRRNQMSSVDFAIARVLGIRDNAMAAVRDAYDVFAQEKNLKIRDENKQIQSEDRKKEELKLSKDLTESKLLFGEIDDWKNGYKQLQSFTKFNDRDSSHNYFDVLYQNIITKGRKLEGYGKTYQSAFRRKDTDGKVKFLGSMNGYEFLQVLLTDRYPKGCCDKDGKSLVGQKIKGVTPEDKLKAFYYLFTDGRVSKNVTDKLYDAFLGDNEEKKNQAQAAMRNDTNRVFLALFDTNIDQMTAEGNVNMEEKLKELDEHLQTSKEKYLRAVQMQLDTANAEKKVEAERKTCAQRLETLESEVKKGISLETTAVAGATAAVNFVQKDYGDMVSGETVFREAVSDIGKDSGVYRKLGEIRENVFEKGVTDQTKDQLLKVPV